MLDKLVQNLKKKKNAEFFSWQCNSVLYSKRYLTHTLLVAPSIGLSFNCIYKPPFFPSKIRITIPNVYPQFHEFHLPVFHFFSVVISKLENPFLKCRYKEYGIVLCYLRYMELSLATGRYVNKWITRGWCNVEEFSLSHFTLIHKA